MPTRDLGDREAMRTFVADVRSVVPRATGLPVQYLESGRAVVGAFQQAFLSALVVISLLLVLAGIVTGAGAVVLGIPFNFANVIVLPLLFGLGVDNGFHLMHRVHRLSPSRHSVLATSTDRGIVLSGLTTLFSFSSLAFTTHRGITTMGQLLVIGVGSILAATLIVLPAFLTRGTLDGSTVTRQPTSPEAA